MCTELLPANAAWAQLLPANLQTHEYLGAQLSAAGTF